MTHDFVNMTTEALSAECSASDPVSKSDSNDFFSPVFMTELENTQDLLQDHLSFTDVPSVFFIGENKKFRTEKNVQITSECSFFITSEKCSLHLETC